MHINEMDLDIDSREIELSSLILIGVILCPASLEVKARVFYD